MSYDIFLSYSRTDQALAERFVQAASGRGLKVWYDQFISGGTDWRDTIVASLRNSRALVILFSEASNASRQLIKELAIADNFSKLVIPVLIEKTEPRGAYLYEMASRNWINLYPGPESRIEALVDRLAGQLAAGNGEPQFSAPRPIGATPERARPSRPAAEAAIPAASGPWFPLGRFDLFILMPLLIYSFIRELTVTDKSGLG
ncbi:MAG: toll/interleukin-1 receptor domain-containing protein, partial [Rhodomicrobium sp.]